MLQRVAAFLELWRAHRALIPAAADVVDDAFLVIAAEENADVSGCAIDEMFGLVQQLEREFGVTMLDASRVFYRDGEGKVRGVTRGAFRALADGETVVFDTTVQKLGSIRNGSWQKRARDSWHARLLAVA